MNNIEEQICALEPYLKRVLESVADPYLKLSIIDEHPLVQEFLAEPVKKYPFLQGKDPKFDLAIRSVIAIGQGPIIFNAHKERPDEEIINDLLNELLEIEHFYEAIGGILGYHVIVLRLICGKCLESEQKGVESKYYHPWGTDISQETREVRRAIRWGLERLPEIAEIYPVGGAGDRLNLCSEATGEALPAARLLFTGRTLLEGLFRDLQAREYLYFKLFNKQLRTPIAMMTSTDKDNHEHIVEICSYNQWFGRTRESYIFMIQPLAPVITKEGNWSLKAPFALTMKPGGHGVIWRLAQERDVFNRLQALGATKALLRQINNPIAGIDYGLLAFTGLGFLKEMLFGFASCRRLLNTAEGMNVLIEKKRKGHYDYCLTNIEYTDFAKRGIQDIPEKEGSSYSAFPANTNILFVDLAAIDKTISSCPFPGKTINMKTKVSYISAEGKSCEVEGGRLETTMQNITDCIIDSFDHPIAEEEAQKLSTFITYNRREKTISVTKKSYSPEGSLNETPEKCFYDLMTNHLDLLINYCQMDAPPLNDDQDYLKNGPSILMLFHPALGPLYSIINQKIRGGKITKGSEMQLEISELEIVNLRLDGSLHILADTPLGKMDGKGILNYNSQTGKCRLHNVMIKNAGIDRTQQNCYWKNSIDRKEICKIVLRGNAEFEAVDVVLEGPHLIEVQDGHRMVASTKNGRLEFHTEKISGPTWHWAYAFDEEDRIRLKKAPTP